MRQLIAAEPLTVGQIVKTAQVTQAAVTQTIGLMANDGLVRVTQGNDDGRQRFVSLTDRGRRMIKKLQQCWDATAMAHADLERELGFSLSTVLDQAITALEHKPYLTRIREARASLAK
jgi:DNA-binding MarR family transcriptional regulator